MGSNSARGLDFTFQECSTFVHRQTSIKMQKEEHLTSASRQLDAEPRSSVGQLSEPLSHFA